MRTILFVFSLCLVIGCNKHEEHHHGHHANAYMNKMDFDMLVQRFESPDREQWQKPNEVINLLGDIGGKTVLDIGSGTGYFSFRLAEKGAMVIAADVDDRFLSYIKEKKNDIGDEQIELRKTKFDDPLLEAEEVHYAMIVNSYHHIDNRTNYFGKVANGLKENGMLMVVDFKKEESPHGPPINHRIAASKVVDELQKAGYSDIQVNDQLLQEHYIVLAYK